MKIFRVGKMGVGEMGRIIGETEVNETGVDEMGISVHHTLCLEKQR